MDLQFFNLPVCVGDVTLRVAHGHFATGHSHTNYFIDTTVQKTSLQAADAVAQQLASRYLTNTMIDTILCMDGTLVIGTCLARQLTQASYHSINSDKDINILTTEINSAGKIFFRDNTRAMVEGKNILILVASMTTGRTAEHGMKAVSYYGGNVTGIAALYSHLTEMNGVPVHTLFDYTDLPDYSSYSPEHCPLCQQGKVLDALVSSFGYTKM